LKLWKALDDNKVESAGTFSEILDCTMGLHNFKELFKSDPGYEIPRRNRTILGEHVFKSREEKKSGIPNEPRQAMVNRASNVAKFKTSPFRCEISLLSPLANEMETPISFQLSFNVGKIFLSEHTCCS
jgi:hypothetical protein